MVEPMFPRTSFQIISGQPLTYSLTSEGSGKRVTISFCATCGTKLFLDLERFPEIFGVYGGTFDNPNWFERTPEISRHIFIDSAQHGTVIPAGVSTFREHSMLNDGTPAKPLIFEQPHTIEKRSGSVPRDAPASPGTRNFLCHYSPLMGPILGLIKVESGPQTRQCYTS
jgi:hypothetical protein